MNEILAILTAVINSLWQAAVVAAIVWAALRFWPRTNAATRYAIWWATLAVVLILPAAPRLITTIRHRTVTAAAKPQAAATPASAAPSRVELIVIPAAPRRAARWPIAVLAIWAAILAWRLYQICRSYLSLRSVKRRAIASAVPLPEIPRRAALLISRDIASPMALGFRKPAIVLPDSLLEELSDAEREHVLLHEAAHLVRRDDWANLASRFLAGALALHPVALWILSRIDREREIACDEWVVSRTGAAQPYAKSLARLFDLLHGRGTQMLASGIFGRGSRIADRIEALLRRGRTFTPRASAPGIILSAVVLFGLMLAGSLAPRWIAFAQEKPPASFEVASVKPGNPDERRTFVGALGPGRFDAVNAPLRMVIGFAYNVHDYQISGGPGWLATAQFTIEARPPRDVSFRGDGVGPPPIMREMVQSLLADRFRLAVHKEVRAGQIYELTIAKGGSKLVEAAQAPANGPQGVGFRGRGHLIGSVAPVGMFAQVLSQMMERPVIDNTGLAGKYNFEMNFTPDTPVTADAPPPDTAGPTVFTALKEQLGLELKPARGPVETLVIDHVEKPDAN